MATDPLKEWQRRALDAEKRLEIRETELECRALVRWFSERMLNRFRAKADKGTTWLELKPEEIYIVLQRKVEEMGKFLDEGQMKNVVEECSDIANLSAMIADGVDPAKR